MANDLAGQTSPYLLQHADNPVNWLPWSDQAFELARERDQLVFLSVGYSTCHWCHVMAHESFENEEIAAVLNHHFVCVKVDREERPDIDSVYMNYLQATTGQGGWPMSAWLTPEGKPVYGGTYFPPQDRYGRAGFPRVCHELARLWRDDRQMLIQRASEVMEQLSQQEAAIQTDELPTTAACSSLLATCEKMFDHECGGFGGAPKFPRPVVVRALMQLSDRFGHEHPSGQSAWSMAESTLRAMANGGMHDQLGGGFHRYSVDRHWHVPHYEKMLYDQAQLAMAYLDGWQISGDPEFKQVAERIFHYLCRIMRDDSGGFHSAEDADSLPSHDADHTREGAFWTWPADEISALLDPRDAAIFCHAYGIQADGNARPESDPHGELKGQNTLFKAASLEELAETFDTSTAEIEAVLQRSAEILMDARGQRPLPHRDDKIAAGWNGLAIGAFARGGRLLGRRDLVAAARDAAAFIRSSLWHDGRLYRSFRQHRSDTAGFAADYIAVIHGLIELHAAAPDEGWLDWAAELQQKLDRDFWDEARAGYLLRLDLAGKCLMEIREDYDGAEPAPNHLAIDNLLKLAALLDDPAHHQRAESMLKAGSDMLKSQPFAAPLLVAGLDLYDRGVAVVHVPAGDAAPDHPSLHQRYWPRACFKQSEGKEITVCENQRCQPYDPDASPGTSHAR